MGKSMSIIKEGGMIVGVLMPANPAAKEIRGEGADALGSARKAKKKALMNTSGI